MRAMKRDKIAKAPENKAWINPDPHGTLRIGGKVFSTYYPHERHIIRTLTHLTPSLLAEGGLASADGGDGGTPIVNVAAAWFLPAVEE